ncbi:integrase catalytic domain-containing protein [Trichonephila clavipes]|uniref:Integrase catalytic domain-containing protein n=1 Tax=Trichonephila clavipes TaxID=2585209 RepID=A0A8X6T346_TRICX|nr:integrase catalytic domain-containing protein [Trichonephila clavipes]
MDKKSKNKNNSNVTTEDKLNRLKDSIKGTLTRLEAFTSEKTVSKDTSVTEIEIKLKKIEQLQINLDKIAEDYCEIEIFESLEIIQLDIEGINQRIETTEVGLKLLMYSLKNSENVNINLNDNGKNSIRLPQIPLLEFSGVIAEFSNFKNQFINLISNNEQLNDSQKLYYLRASLKGEAKLLESPSDSFDSIFKALEDRYETKRQLIDSHVLEIINYEKIYNESAKELRALMDCINRNIRALKVLKYEQNDLSDIILINIILQKIDKESRKQFELSLKTAEFPTFDSIMKFLEKRSAVLENITRIPSTKMINKNTAMSTKAESLEGNVILQNTKFGYLVTGTLPQSQQQANCCLISEPSLDITVKKFFELESLPDESKEITKCEEEIYCEEHFVSTYKRDKTGRFIVRLPIKENAETLLGYSKENAIKLLNGHMEEIKNETLDKINYYIPHHSVYKPEKTSTPLRVVFDASAKTTSGFSLNSILLNGGIIQQDLFSIVSRFRKHEYAFSADIKKMYRQILVDPNQRDLQRIMWKTSADAPVKTYKLATVTYGTVSAPILATRTLRALANEEKAEFPDAADVICNDSYMDDILSGESTLEGAKNSKSDYLNY